MDLTDLARSVLERAAITAERWPTGHADYWGRTSDGRWTEQPAEVGEQGCPALTLSRSFGLFPNQALGWLIRMWLDHEWGSPGPRGRYLGDLQEHPTAIAQHLRELAADDGALADLGHLRGMRW